MLLYLFYPLPIFNTLFFIMKRFVFFMSLLGCAVVANAQADLQSTLTTYATKFQPEKVFIHYDKASYYPGQTVWFKAYVTEDGLPATSKTLYTDWIAEDGKVLHHGVAPMVDGMTNGQFDIPEDFTGKFIQVRAYTKWMLNFDSAFVYTHDLRVLQVGSGARPAKPVPTLSLRFFAEGGDLIAGVNNKVAFKAADQWGRPFKAKGIVVDAKGVKLDSFKTTHDGMGYLYMIPAAGMTYTARWKDDKGVEQSTALPAVRSSGLGMQVTLSPGKRIISLQTPLPLTTANQKWTLVGTMNQHPIFQTEVVPSAEGTARRVIPTQALPSGILTLTVLDADLNAVAERVTFINNGEYRFQTGMQVARWGLSKRARNEIEISLPDSIAAASLSISVTDAAIDADTSENIYSALLLTGDLRGYIHNPAYYFANTDDSLQQKLDLVMLTNGWRRFQWDQVTKGVLPKLNYAKDTSYLTLSGNVYGVAKSMLTGKESMVLFIKSKDSASSQTRIVGLNTNGTFNDPEVLFFDTLRVYYQLKSKLLGNAEARFMTERLPAPNYLAASKSFFNRRAYLDTAGLYKHSMLSYETFRRQQQERSKMLANVTVTAKAKTPVQSLDEKYARGLFSGGDATQFDLVNDVAAMGSLNIFNYLQGRVAGLQINAGSNPPSLTWRGGTPQLYLDEMPVDADLVRNIPIADVAYIKVFRPPFMGTGGGNGGIAIYTRRGDDQRNTPGRGLSSSMVMGYSNIREFYSPDYSRFDRRNEQPDVRTTLYWNPGVIATKGRPVKLSFYNNDVTKAFRIIITGMTKDGLMTYHQEMME
jgi:hypothetical protein